MYNIPLELLGRALGLTGTTCIDIRDLKFHISNCGDILVDEKYLDLTIVQCQDKYNTGHYHHRYNTDYATYEGACKIREVLCGDLDLYEYSGLVVFNQEVWDEIEQIHAQSILDSEKKQEVTTMTEQGYNYEYTYEDAAHAMGYKTASGLSTLVCVYKYALGQPKYMGKAYHTDNTGKQRLLKAFTKEGLFKLMCLRCVGKGAGSMYPDFDEMSELFDGEPEIVEFIKQYSGHDPLPLSKLVEFVCKYRAKKDYEQVFQITKESQQNKLHPVLLLSPDFETPVSPAAMGIINEFLEVINEVPEEQTSPPSVEELDKDDTTPQGEEQAHVAMENSYVELCNNVTHSIQAVFGFFNGYMQMVLAENQRQVQAINLLSQNQTRFAEALQELQQLSKQHSPSAQQTEEAINAGAGFALYQAAQTVSLEALKAGLNREVRYLAAQIANKLTESYAAVYGVGSDEHCTRLAEEVSNWGAKLNIEIMQHVGKQRKACDVDDCKKAIAFFTTRKEHYSRRLDLVDVETPTAADYTLATDGKSIKRVKWDADLDAVSDDTYFDVCDAGYDEDYDIGQYELPPF